jgi:predicted nucleotidyltransferase
MVNNHARDYIREQTMKSTSPNSAFDLMTTMSAYLRKEIRESYQKNTSSTSKTAIFLHGSPSRNEMTSYSDIDILVATDNPRYSLENEMPGFLSSLENLGFGKIDVLDWNYLAHLDLVASNSIIDGNKVLDASFIYGDSSIREIVEDIKRDRNTKERAIENLVFQKYYLEHYYSKRSTPQVPNVKYQEGGHRDFLMYNWAANLMRLYKKDWINIDPGQEPLLKASLKELHTNGMLNAVEYQRAMTSTQYIIFLRNEILHVNYHTINKNITHLDQETLEKLWSSQEAFFRQWGALRKEDIRTIYEVHRSITSETKRKLFSQILDEEASRKGPAWKKEFDLALQGNATHCKDTILQIASIWEINKHSNKEAFEIMLNRTKRANSFPVLASLACSEMCTSEALEEIREKTQPRFDQWYILKIISRNPNATFNTLTKIAYDESLGQYGTVAAKRLQEGLEIAVKKSS